MNIYRYSKDSVIDEVAFQKSDGGSHRAYLHALPTTDEKTIADISQAMAKRGWQTVPHSEDGKFTLEIRGFSRDSQITNELIKHNWINGSPQVEKDKQQPTKFTDTVKKRSLFLSGLAYIVGDISFFRYGQRGKSPFDMAAGLAYGGGTASSLLFARKDTSDLQIKDVATKMAGFMRTQNIDVPENCSLNSITNDKHKGLIKTTDDYFRRYPAEMMNTFFAIAGGAITVAALRNKVFNKSATKQMKNSGLFDVGLGTMTMASAAFGNLVEEKAHDPDSPKKHGLAGAWEWAQERPLAVTGMGYMVSTMLHAVSTAKDWKHGNNESQKSIKWRGLFVATNLLAEALVAISSKGHGKGVISDKSVDDSAISIAADLIAKQPAAQQNHLVEYMAGFLGREDVLAMKDDEVKKLLKTQVELVKKNPWAQCKETAMSPATPQEKPLLVPSTHETNWQAVTKSSQQNLSHTSFI